MPAMNHGETDQTILERIRTLVDEEHRLYGQGAVNFADRERLTQIEVELDQCWDLLRRRRALRRSGADPDEARVRKSDIVENYEP